MLSQARSNLTPIIWSIQKMPRGIPRCRLEGFSAECVKGDGGSGKAGPSLTAGPDNAIDSILDKVVDRIDLTGLEQKLVDQLSVKLGSTIRVDQLADTILGHRAEELSERLIERVLAKMMGV